MKTLHFHCKGCRFDPWFKGHMRFMRHMVHEGTVRSLMLWGAARNIIIVKLSNRALKRREKKGKESLLALKMS